ncbi:MAG: hypothetical protein ACXW3D_03340 [Caulobacteraceae bacterium]
MAGALPHGEAVTIAALRTLAVLEAASGTATVFGGVTRSWTEVAAIWVDLKPSGVREAAADPAPPVLIETAEAEARKLPAALAGQRLRAGGAPWRVVAVTPDQPKPGRMILTLERRWPS